MDIQTNQSSGVTIVSPRGKIVIGEPVEAFEETIIDLVDRGEHRLVIDLANVTRIDSSGVGSLVSALRNCRDAGGDVLLAGPSDHLRKVLEMMGLEQVFEIQATTEEAVARLGAGGTK